MDLQKPSCRIAEAARRSGVAAASIRYYERERLLPAVGRADNRYRLYGDDDIHRLRFIRLCRAMDMSLDEVRALLGLDLADKADCGRARDLLTEHLDHVQARLRELQSLEEDLRHLRDRCDGRDDTCHLIATLHARADLPASRGPSASGGSRGPSDPAHRLTRTAGLAPEAAGASA
jgi:DNA-binding transcriptional MerR regulator